MSAPGSHCPFLNRSDARCVENFSMARLNHALEYCVGSYTACPVYIELLVERRSKRAAAAEQNWRDGKRVVQISVHGRNVERHSADLAAVAVAPGV